MTSALSPSSLRPSAQFLCSPGEELQGVKVYLLSLFFESFFFLSHPAKAFRKS